MPIYEYRCQSCSHELEKLQRLSDPVLTDCPACGKAELRRLISAAGFRLKGAGWYETDFKQGNKRNLAESSDRKGDGAATAGSSESKDGKGETAAKAEPPAGKSEAAGDSAKSAGSDIASSAGKNKATIGGASDTA